MTRGDDMHKVSRSVAVAVLAVVILATGSTPVFAEAPRPVIPVSFLEGGQQPPPADSSVPPEDPEEGDQSEPDPGCHFGGPTAGIRPLVLAGTGSDSILSAPRPVLPVSALLPAESACQTQLSLDLTVESRRGREPEGADANVEELAVPRMVLESGFQTTLPAGSRVITLSDPGDEWEVTETDCTCGGAAGSAISGPVAITSRLPLAMRPAAGPLASYPRPVIPIASLGGGGVTCPAPSAGTTLGVGQRSGGEPLATDPGLDLTSGGPRPMAQAPRPVIPVGSVRRPAETDTSDRAPARVSWTRSGTVRINDFDRAGANVSCHWTVEHVYGRASTRTVTEPPGHESDINYRLVPDSPGEGKTPQSIQGSPTEVERKLREGGWTLTAAEPKRGWRLERSECSETDSEIPTTAQGTTAQVGVDPGDRVTCTFYWELLTPKPGPWVGVNHPGKAVCANAGGEVTFPLERSRDRGRLSVRKGGDRVVAKGTEGFTVTMDRDAADPLRFKGTVTRTYQGMKAKFRYDVELIDEERMRGTMSMTAKGKGNTCTFSRKITLTHAGG